MPRVKFTISRFSLSKGHRQSKAAEVPDNLIRNASPATKHATATVSQRTATCPPCSCLLPNCLQLPKYNLSSVLNFCQREQFLPFLHMLHKFVTVCTTYPLLIIPSSLSLFGPISSNFTSSGHPRHTINFILQHHTVRRSYSIISQTLCPVHPPPFCHIPFSLPLPKCQVYLLTIHDSDFS